MGFEAVDLASLHIHPGSDAAQTLVKDFAKRMAHYEDTRNFPAVKGPSYLSVHLRFGTVSVRQLVRLAYPSAMAGDAGAQTWLSELIWRDFYHQIMHHHPHAMTRAFKPEYDAIEWEKGKQAKGLFQAWCDGQTGYPLVDAAMAQINQTGYMHNRLRMVVASFLVKDLGIDWRWGESYFALHLNDFDLAANNGGWQWASSSGCDAQPYFRIFNPISQSEKFDPQGNVIYRSWPACLTKTSMRHGWPSLWRCKPPVLNWVRTIHCPWWTMPMQGPKPCCVIPWSARKKPFRWRPSRSLLCGRRIQDKSSSWELVPKVCQGQCLRREHRRLRRKSSRKSSTSKFCSQCHFQWVEGLLPHQRRGIE
jgi:hypothetical protein